MQARSASYNSRNRRNGPTLVSVLLCWGQTELPGSRSLPRLGLSEMSHSTIRAGFDIFDSSGKFMSRNERPKRVRKPMIIDYDCSRRIKIILLNLVMLFQGSANASQESLASWLAPCLCQEHTRETLAALSISKIPILSGNRART